MSKNVIPFNPSNLYKYIINPPMRKSYKFGKVSRIVLFSVTVFVFTFIIFSSIGFFTSSRDDKMFKLRIIDELETYKNTKLNYVKVKEIVNKQVFCFSNEDQMNLYEDVDDLNKQLEIHEKNKRKDAGTSNIENIKNEYYKLKGKYSLQTNLMNITNIDYIKYNGLFASFGDAFTFRLVSIYNRVLNSIKKIAFNKTEKDTDVFMIFKIGNDTVKINLFRFTVDECIEKKYEYYFAEIGENLTIKDINFYVLCQMFE